jgi:hypothetical protein
VSAASEGDVSSDGAANSVGTVCESENSDADSRTSYEDMEAIIFGRDPGDWAEELHHRLSMASMRLHQALAHQADPAREITDAADAEALANVREKAVHVIATLYETLAAMPIMQGRPYALDGLDYVLTSIYDVERGSAPDWLIAKPTKAHPKRMNEQIEWKLIVYSVQLLRLLPDFKTEDAAVNEIARRTQRPSGTIKRWCRKLYSPDRHEVPEARDWIKTELMGFRVALNFIQPEFHRNIIDKKISELLP